MIVILIIILQEGVGHAGPAARLQLAVPAPGRGGQCPAPGLLRPLHQQPPVPGAGAAEDTAEVTVLLRGTSARAQPPASSLIFRGHCLHQADICVKMLSSEWKNQ